ncbi:olfactory receptor 14J1-like [Anser cygnoides]|uniref:olfactory receptor 14J1-like n=1 Tax=Anser cygnoides TaxID=8845 RepID=UPI0034D3068D
MATKKIGVIRLSSDPVRYHTDKGLQPARKQLHYGSVVGSRACAQMAAAAWGSGFLHAVLHTATTFSLPLCQGNAVDQFFCEIPQILKLSCSGSDYLKEVVLLVVSACLAFGCFVFIVVSYVQILRAVLRMPSEQGLHKDISTCLPHLAVVSLFVSTAMFAYLKPPSISSPSLDLVVALLYVVVPPAVNPLIYSMRNQELKATVKKLTLVVLFILTRFPVGSYWTKCPPYSSIKTSYDGTAMFAYLKPPSISSPTPDLVVAVLYSVVPPALNPLIYSMRNKDLKEAMKKLFGYMLFLNH